MVLVCGVDPNNPSDVYPLPINNTDGLLVQTSGLQKVTYFGGNVVIGCGINASDGKVYALPVGPTGLLIGSQNTLEVMLSDIHVVLCGINSQTGKVYALPANLSGNLVEVPFIGGPFKLGCGDTYILPVTSTDWRGSNPVSPTYFGDGIILIQGIDPDTQNMVSLPIDNSGVLVQSTGPGGGFWQNNYFAPRYWTNSYFK